MLRVIQFIGSYPMQGTVSSRLIQLKDDSESIADDHSQNTGRIHDRAALRMREPATLSKLQDAVRCSTSITALDVRFTLLCPLMYGARPGM